MDGLIACRGCGGVVLSGSHCSANLCLVAKVAVVSIWWLLVLATK